MLYAVPVAGFGSFRTVEEPADRYAGKGRVLAHSILQAIALDESRFIDALQIFIIGLLACTGARSDSCAHDNQEQQEVFHPIILQAIHHNNPLSFQCGWGGQRGDRSPGFLARKGAGIIG